ncbi:hypothetical protein [Streptomyces formicae]|uniref:Integral membrane protein n=1 Tax=Streptomyces formicae TaxID=1616117 RepID=A0ABY3WN08_9ACTN|nr:hypothetical protein [Streptomyces formicae]UNM13525.1 hypothetical protein J4032_20440 [Streptomyces formicae]
MERGTRTVPGREADGAEPPGLHASNTDWARERRAAIGCAGLLLALLLLIDGGSGRLTAPRAVLWTGLAALLFTLLLPARVTAGELVSARWSDDVSQLLVLRDLEGGRVELDPGILVAHPQLWRHLDAGARTSLGRGTLLCGATALR